MRTSNKGLLLIKEFEGLRLAAYLCPANVWTVGYGHTSAAGPPNVHSGMRITQAEADAILRRDLVRYESAVSRLVKVPLNQSQFDAMSSFCFNVGEGALGKSTLLRKLNRGEYGAVPAELMKWTRGGGKELPGLVRRRRAEAKLWRDLDSKPEAPDEARVQPEAPKPTKSMAQSKEGNTAALAGAGAALAAGNEAARTIKETADNVSGVSSLLTDSTFIVLALVVAACAAIWFFRRQRLEEEA
jgi:lysozyme